MINADIKDVIWNGMDYTFNAIYLRKYHSLRYKIEDFLRLYIQIY